MAHDQFYAELENTGGAQAMASHGLSGGFRMAKVSVPRGPNRFTERELARALRAAHRAGGVARVEVDLDGRIVLVTAQPESASGNDLDNWLEKRGKDARPT
jgi:hypothetical protein